METSIVVDASVSMVQIAEGDLLTVETESSTVINDGTMVTR